MPRIARVTYPGGFYHIFNRGINKSPIFHKSSDYEMLLKKLTQLLTEGDWTIYSYCLMPNHFHFLIEEHKSPIAKLLGRLFTSYGLYFNKKYNRSGPIFQDRFKSKLVQKETYFFEVSRYIHLNPVKSRLCPRPADYKYSSIAEYTGKIRRNIIDMDKISLLLKKSKTGIENYLKFLEEGVDKDLEKFNPFKNKKDIIGSAAFATNRKRYIIKSGTKS